MTAACRGALFCVLIVASLLGGARAALAHEVGLSRGEYRLTEGVLAIELSFAQRDLATSFPDVPATGIDRAIFGALHVSSGAERCLIEGTSVSARGDDAVLRAHAFCPGGATELSLALDFLAPFPAGHRHLAHVRAGRVDEENVLRPSAHTLRTETGAPVGDARAASIGSFMRLGIEHILTGYDHLVFLFGLVVIGGEPRSLVKAITAFTVAHSLSLALAVLDVWTPSPRFIEPAIALSIAYVGVENFFVRDASTRWRVTLPFGFIHGFGFAGALMERHLPPSRVPPALLGFNAGVELGQLALLAVVLPLVMVARRYAVVRNRAVPTASAMVVALGLGWLTLRIRDALH